MSILLINVVGFTACSAVVGLYGMSMYKQSKIEAVTDTYDGVLPEYDLQTEAIGLGIQMVGSAADVVGDVTEKLFDSSLSHKMRNLFGRFQIEADGEYFRFRSGKDWDGYGDEAPKVKPGKFDIQI